MATVTGVVEAMSNKFDKYSILVDGKWYSSKFEIRCEKGDTVEFDDGGKNYCQKLKVAGKGSGGGTPVSPGPGSAGKGFSRGVFPVPLTDGSRAIIRQNSITNAVNLVNSLMPEVSKTLTLEQVAEMAEYRANLAVDLARILENYSAGDGDLAEAEKEMAEAA